jgi:hypothetical protein
VVVVVAGLFVNNSLVEYYIKRRKIDIPGTQDADASRAPVVVVAAVVDVGVLPLSELW